MFSGVEFVEKLAALVPQPRIHLTRFFGCLAPHSKISSEIVPKKEDEDKAEAHVGEPGEKKKSLSKYSGIRWAELLARTFGIDTKHCHNCGGPMKKVVLHRHN